MLEMHIHHANGGCVFLRKVFAMDSMSPIIHKPSYSFLFGNAHDNVRTNLAYCDQRFLSLKNKLGENVKTLFFLKQTHSADVFVIDEFYNPRSPLDLFHHDGDAIITNQKNCAIGVVTADCLPVVLYDRKNNVIAVIHAGWRGLAAKIITATIQ